MTYALIRDVGGASQDIAMEAPSSAVASSACTVVTTAARLVTGPTAILHPLNTSAAKAIVSIGTNIASPPPKVFVLSGWVGASGAFSTTAGLISTVTQGGNRYVRINTSGQIELYDSNGTKIGGTSTSAISTTAMTYVEIVYDFGVLSTESQTTAWISVKVGGRWQWEGLCKSPSGNIIAVDDTLTLGEYLPAATNRGADLYTDDWVARYSESRGADIPAHKAYPIIKITGGAARPPVGNGSNVAWVLSDGGTADYTRVDEYPNDGETSWVGTQTVNLKETYWSSAANPLTSADTVHHVMQRAVERTLAGGKFAFNFLYRDASANEFNWSPGTPGTSYVGMLGEALFPPTGSPNLWVYTDFDNFSGTSTGATTGPPGTMTDTGAVGWDVNIFAGAVVTSGGKTLTVASNTTTVITGTGGWSGGGNPGAAAYTIGASKLQFGGQAGGSASVDFRCTSMPGPEIVYSTASSIFSQGTE